MPSSIPEESLIERARQQTFRWLTGRPRSEKEIRWKLHNKGYTESVIDKVVAGLYESAYLDDAAFAHQWARNLAVNRRLGDRRIEMSLLDKGITRDHIHKVLLELRQETPERSVICEFIRKKTGGRLFNHMTNQEKARIIKSLYRKGFTLNAIRDAIDQPVEDFFQ